MVEFCLHRSASQEVTTTLKSLANFEECLLESF